MTINDPAADLSQIGDALSRTVKMAMDSGEAPTLEAAIGLFHGYRLRLHLGDEGASSPTHQAAALTAVNTARRCFLGGCRNNCEQRVWK